MHENCNFRDDVFNPILSFVTYGFVEEVFWQFSLLTVNSNNTRKEISLLTIQQPIDYTSVVDNARVLPLAGHDKALHKHLIHLASPYILRLRMVNKQGVVNQQNMRSIVLSGLQLYMEIEYLKDDYYTDFGRNGFLIAGILQGEPKNDIERSLELSNIFWVFPLNINSDEKHMLLVLPELTVGDHYISQLGLAYHVVDHDYLTTAATFSISGNNNLVVNPLTSMDMFGKENFVVLSHDEFSTYIVKQLPTLSDSADRCPSALVATFKILDMLIHFNKGGTYLVYYNHKNQTIHSQMLQFLYQPFCPKYVSALPWFNQSQLMMSTKNHLVFAHSVDAKNYSSSTPKVAITEVIDVKGVAVCLFLSLRNADCTIVCHTFSIQCCHSYILVSKVQTHEYILVKYWGILDAKIRGKWEIVFRFYDKLPSNINPFALNYVLLHYTLFPNGAPISITGLSVTNMANNCVFLWGNVLLVYSLDTSSLFLILPSLFPNPSAYFTNQNIKQLVFEKDGNKYALLMDNGDIWFGRLSCAVNKIIAIKHNQTALNYNGASLSNIIGLFYDSFSVLHLLSITNQVTKKRIHVEYRNLDDSLVMSSSCSDIFNFQRRREFVMEPPRKWPLNLLINSSDSNRISDHKHAVITTYNDEMFTAHRTAAYLIFQNEFIAKLKQNYSSLNWYFSADGFHEYLEFVSRNNLNIGYAWTAYLSRNDYDLKKFSTTIDCSTVGKVYLDSGKKLALNFTVGTRNLQYPIGDEVTIFVSISNNSLLDYRVQKLTKFQPLKFHIELIGQTTKQQPPGINLQLVTAVLWPWYAGQPDLINSGEISIQIKVGCPPGLSMVFDEEASQAGRTLRGRGDIFNCLKRANKDIPCITVSEFVPIFYIMDDVFRKKQPFSGNFTMKVVGGGVGYVENIQLFTEEEIDLYNYSPGSSQSDKSLIWLATNDGQAQAFKDKETGQLIFDSNNPTKITFDCQINSPCGNILLTKSNPSEYYMILEITNKRVDSSTNCDFTKRFVLQLVGLELNPYSHLLVVLVTVLMLLVGVYIYYIYGGGVGKKLLISCVPRKFQSRKWNRITQQLGLTRKIDLRSSVATLSSSVSRPGKQATGNVFIRRATSRAERKSRVDNVDSPADKSVTSSTSTGVSGPLIRISKADIGGKKSRKDKH